MVTSSGLCMGIRAAGWPHVLLPQHQTWLAGRRGRWKRQLQLRWRLRRCGLTPSFSAFHYIYFLLLWMVVQTGRITCIQNFIFIPADFISPGQCSILRYG
ncbi:hypothetical protein BT93_L3825 [Corymbia citriodora subsp. variegata]|uniref:Uncharacterized protein n=1 Tax=Corymbia citriodora subsp. variegata TaxID=360336 RepID=A0A8T0CV79_CORYI|nr:hypothetical protein BT93_L3825 [Corymbia citriodora subsp. variegata]